MDFVTIFSACKEIMDYEFTYMGYTFSLWNVMIYSFVAFCLLCFLLSFFSD